MSKASKIEGMLSRTAANVEDGSIHRPGLCEANDLYLWSTYVPGRNTAILVSEVEEAQLSAISDVIGFPVGQE